MGETYPEIGMRLVRLFGPVRLFGQSTLMKLGDQRRVLATGSDAIGWNPNPSPNPNPNSNPNPNPGSDAIGWNLKVRQ
eukprot:scaffold11856_cov54-Phaeocystis_antarctica.AAC.6